MAHSADLPSTTAPPLIAPVASLYEAIEDILFETNLAALWSREYLREKVPLDHPLYGTNALAEDLGAHVEPLIAVVDPHRSALRSLAYGRPVERWSGYSASGADAAVDMALEMKERLQRGDCGLLDWRDLQEYVTAEQRIAAFLLQERARYHEKLSCGERKEPAPPAMRHSADFSQVIWGKEEFLFPGALMRGVVKCLWEAWEAGAPTLSESTIQEKAECESRLVHLFRGHRAWARLIVRRGKGLFSLVEPS